MKEFDGAMSHEAFEKLNPAIGGWTLPLKTEVVSLKDVAAPITGSRKDTLSARSSCTSTYRLARAR
jgi:hypothetical protein